MAAQEKPQGRLQTPGARVNLRNLTKLFGEVVAVDHIDLEIDPGHFLTLLGPSGSGKTTTLLMIAGFQLPTEGEVYLDEEPITYRPPHKRDIGLVFQHYALFPHMTVAENIAFPLEMRRFDNKMIREKVREVLEIVRLPGYEHRYPKQLSGGQQQRVALARCVVFNPRLLLMDEPLGALDKKLREEMQLEIKHIQEELGITVVYVTHDQEEALTMSDRIAVMHLGEIQQVDTPDRLYERPANRFVADFIGESNFFRGRIAELNGDSCVLLTDHNLRLVGPRLNGVQEGEQVHFAVRPERPVFLDEHEELPNVLEGIVKEVIYVGDTTKYEIGTDRNEPFIIKHANRRGRRRYTRGDRIKIGWDIEDVISLKD